RWRTGATSVGDAAQYAAKGPKRGRDPPVPPVRPVRLRPCRGEPGRGRLGQSDRGDGRAALPRTVQSGRPGRQHPRPYLGQGRPRGGRARRGCGGRAGPAGPAPPRRAPPGDVPGRSLSIALLSYSTKPRGGVVHTLCLAAALAAAGHEVTVWPVARCGDTGFFRPVDPAVRQEIVPFPEYDGEGVGQRILRSIAVLRAAFDPGRYDIVHAQDCISANAVDRCIRTVHHIDHFTTPELVACHERAIVTPCAHVCVSAAAARELREGWGINATVIPNGVQAQRFAAAAGTDPPAVHARERWRARLGRYVLAVGGIEPRKGSLDLLDAYALLRRDNPDLRLVVAGGETLFDYRDYRAEWQSRAARLGLDPVVLGPVAHDDLPALVASAAVFA